MIASGLILSRHWQDTGEGQLLEFWLATQAGPLRVQLEGQESVLFVPADRLKPAGKVLQGQLNYRQREVDLRCFQQSDQPVVALYFRNQRDLGLARALLQQHSIQVYESDIRPTDRYLMERFIRGAAEVEGDIQNPGEFRSVLNPHMKPARAGAENVAVSLADGLLKVVSLDIETSMARQVVLSVAIYGHGIEKVFMQGEDLENGPGYLEFLPDEKSLLCRFLSWFQALDPDVIIGWSVVNFDLKYLQDRCDALGIPFNLGRDTSPVRWRFLDQGQQRVFAVVPGRVVLDGIELLRTATYSFESFSLENVSRELLGRGKLVEDVDSRAHEIEAMHRSDPAALARYNLEDCVLVWDIFDQTDLIAFAVQRACLTGLEMDRQGGSVAAFDFLYLPRLHRAGYVAPVVDADSVTHSPGGYVLDSVPGIYEHVVVLDFKSLYPSIIRTFHVDPLAMVEDEGEQIPGFLGASFSKERFILPTIIEELWAARDRARQAGDAPGSQAIKIIMNSFYGVLGTPGCRFFDPRLASSITMRGHEILQQTRDLIEAAGYRVIYGDTDSVFVLMDMAREEVEVAAAALAVHLNQWWRDSLRQKYDIESFLEIEFETHFTRFFMPTVRGSDKGSKKRYAGMVDNGREQHLVFKGLESVRSDWSPLARKFQQELFQRIFTDQPVEDYVRSVVSAVGNGELDDQLVLRRRLRRKLDDYVRNVPPHVRAARAADRERNRQGLPPQYQQGGGWIEYVMTVNGPEPLRYQRSSLDYGFYIDRQLAPIADAVLGFSQTTLAELTDKQLGLF